MMTDESQLFVQEQVRKISLFSELPYEEIQHLVQVLHPKQYLQGEILFNEGDLGDHFSIILDGQVEIIKSIDTPEERLLNLLGPGDFLGEMSLLHQEQQRSASARSQTFSRHLEMSKHDFDTLLLRQPRVAIRILREMSQRLRDSMSNTIRDLRIKNRQLAQAYSDLQAAQAQLIEKEILEHELNLARQIQENSLPKDPPRMSGWHVDASWQPARVVSGDFYDFIALPDGKLCFLIADVTGKGVPAALVMATTHSVLRAVITANSDPSVVLGKVNDVLFEETPHNMFVTCFYAVLDPITGHIAYANAGHSLPFHLKAQGFLELHATGMPLGSLPGITYDQKETVIQPEEELFLFSDGLIEAHNNNGEMFGMPRLRERLAILSHSQGLFEQLLRELHDFTGSGDQEDDITLVSIQRLS